MHSFQCRISKQSMKEKNLPSESIHEKDLSETRETALTGLTLRGEGASPTGFDCSDLTIRRKSLHVRGKTSVRHRVSSAGWLANRVILEVLAGTSRQEERDERRKAALSAVTCDTAGPPVSFGLLPVMVHPGTGRAAGQLRHGSGGGGGGGRFMFM